MFNFLKNLFKPLPIFPLGVFDTASDTRTINTVAVQPPVTLPEDYNIDMVPVITQTKPDCVACAVHEIKELFLKEKGQYVDLSEEDLYDQCKAQDGVPDQPGTYPLVGAKVAVSSGMASLTVYQSGDKNAIEADRAKYKLGGFMSVAPDFDHVCQAIFQNKAATAAFQVDGNWFSGLIAKVVQSIGKHEVVLHGFIYSKQIVRGQNSWGVGWMGKVAGLIDPKLQAGHFDVYWPDVVDSVSDIFAYTDSMPAPVIDHVKSLNYYFTKSMKLGDKNYDVLQLQKRLSQEGFWPATQDFTSFYGMVTASQVLAYQMAKKVIVHPEESAFGDQCGPKTLRQFNGEVGLDLVHAEIMQESQGNDYVIGDLSIDEAHGGHAYGCLQIRSGVIDAVNAVWGTKYVARDMLGNRDLSIKVWNTYFEKCHPENVTDFDKMKAWNGGPAWRNLYGKPLYGKYTRQLDAYCVAVYSKMATSTL